LQFAVADQTARKFIGIHWVMLLPYSYLADNIYAMATKHVEQSLSRLCFGEPAWRIIYGHSMPFLRRAD
jgi:hypothetical protein